MHFYLPRRHRRPLLFPPGLLALAGLLWLGCVALGPWQGRLKPMTMLQLTMPTLASSPAKSKDCLFCAPSLSKIRNMGPWHNTYFTGIFSSNSYERVQIANNVHAMMADSEHRGRVRVQFAPAARYKDLIFVLDLVNAEGVPRYWLDVHNKPVTFYAFSEVHERRRPANFNSNSVTWYSDGQMHHGSMMGCIITEDIIPSMTPSISFWDPTWLQPLLQPEWRVSAWFLAAIVALSGWRVIGPRRATKTA